MSKRGRPTDCDVCDQIVTSSAFRALKREFMEHKTFNPSKKRPVLTDGQKSFITNRFYDSSGKRHSICRNHLCELSAVSPPTLNQFKEHALFMHGKRPPVFDPEKARKPYRRENMPSPALLKEMKVFLESIALPDPKNSKILRLQTHIDTWNKVYKEFIKVQGPVISDQTFNRHRKSLCPHIKVFLWCFYVL